MTFSAKGAAAPRILCAGILVLDEVFRVKVIPQPDTKVEAEDFFIVNGGCAANAAVAIARLGGRAMLASPLGGPAGKDDNGDRVLAALARENVDTAACQRVDGAIDRAFGDFRRCARRPHDRDVSRQEDRDGHAARSGSDHDRGRSDPRRQPIPAIRPPDLRSGAAAQHPGRTRRRQGDGRGRSAFPHRLACGFFHECLSATTGRAILPTVSSRSHAYGCVPAVSNGPNDILYLEDGRSAACRCSKFAPSIRSPPATRCTAGSRWRWRRAQRGRGVALRCRGRRPQMQPHRRRRRHADRAEVEALMARS